MTTYPEFTGETYSYSDAIARAPHAWATVVHSGECADGSRWAREERQRAPGVVGLGTFERRGKTWIYITPIGYALPVNEQFGQDTPPPLPRPAREHRQATCHCGPHTCSACGQPTWIEWHGSADGYCTYCYFAG